MASEPDLPVTDIRPQQIERFRASTAAHRQKLRDARLELVLTTHGWRLREPQGQYACVLFVGAWDEGDYQDLSAPARLSASDALDHMMLTILERIAAHRPWLLARRPPPPGLSWWRRLLCLYTDHEVLVDFSAS